jgi:hypothetical protein
VIGATIGLDDAQIAEDVRSRVLLSL